ncbi:MAG: glycosyltransferase family 39 protein [Candidatus Glassbacteria bacterium]|nr:glycosyltransferase family 39 protein [Candidatus Glassbacteria bacterium]
MPFGGGVSSLLVRGRYLALLLLCAALYVPNLGGYLLFDVDEPRYAETARVMVETGEWVVPYFNGEYRFEKPVLTYWLIGASYKLFGVGEFGARLPSALAAAGTVLLTCLAAGRLFSSGTGLAAGAILAVCLQFVGLGRMALTDMHLAFFITATLATFVIGIGHPERNRRRLWLLGTWFASALAVLTKGPVGLVLPGAVALAYIALSGDIITKLRNVPWLTGFALFCLTTLPWYAAVTLRSDFEFFRTFIIRHNLQRFAGEVAAGGQHVEPFYYYVPVVLLGVLPWTFFLAQAVIVPMRETAVSLVRSRRVSDPRLFPLLWALGVIGFFSIARAKLPTYVTPAYPALAILLAVYLAGLRERARREGALGGSLWIPAALTFGLVAAIGGFLLFGPKDLAPFPLGGLPAWCAAALVAGPLTALILLKKHRLHSALGAAVTGQAAFSLVLALGVLPLVSEHRQKPQKQLVERACDWLGNSGSLAAYRYRKTAIPFYARRTVAYYELQDLQAGALSGLGRPAAVITRTRHLRELLEGTGGSLTAGVEGDLALVLLLR